MNLHNNSLSERFIVLLKHDTIPTAASQWFAYFLSARSLGMGHSHPYACAVARTPGLFTARAGWSAL